MRTGKNKTNISEDKHRYLSLQTKLGFSFSILTIVTSAMLTLVLYQTVRSRLREDVRQRLYDIVNISALQVDGDAHANLVDPAQEGNTTYMCIKRVLQNIHDKGADIRYVYTWRRNANGQLVFIVDAETDPEEISHLGDVYTSAEPSLLAELATLDHPMVDKKFTTDKWGIWLSGYSPFYRSDGQMEGILGIDIAALDVVSHERQFLWVALGVFAAIIPLASISGWLLGRKLAAPIVRLTVGSKRIAEGDLSHRVNIQSNDDVGNLAESFNGMAQSLQKTIMDRDQEIANRKKAENNLEVLNKDLQSTVQQLSQANRELKEFAYIAAHDLKAPVRAIGSLAGMISNDCRDILNEQSKQQLDMLVQRTERMDEFINGILKYSILEHVAVQKEKVDINDVIKVTIDQVGVPKETIEITVENKLPVLAGQRTHITQIFQNLLDNAVKYMDKPKGRIRIGCVERDDFWQFSVADNGPGIEEKYFDKIFQIFQTLNRRDKIESTGIGLSLVRKIVELYGGEVWVESKPGEGSTFFFTLPKQETGVKNEELYANIVS
ncbi:MAG: ATP-binding protein [Planctomycetota bacterium]